MSKYHPQLSSLTEDELKPLKHGAKIWNIGKNWNKKLPFAMMQLNDSNAGKNTLFIFFTFLHLWHINWEQNDRDCIINVQYLFTDYMKFVGTREQNHTPCTARPVFTTKNAPPENSIIFWSNSNKYIANTKRSISYFLIIAVIMWAIFFCVGASALILLWNSRFLSCSAFFTFIRVDYW